MRVDGLTNQGNKQNEDVYFVSDNLGLVCDGASGLFKEKASEFESDAQWLTNRLKDYLVPLLQDFSKSITECLEESCEILLKEYKEMIAMKGWTFDEEKLPSCTVSIIRCHPEFVEVYQLGDSPIIISLIVKTVVLDDPILNKYDNDVTSEMVRLAKEHKTDVKDQKEAIAPILLENRQQKNTKEGYWILDPLGAAIPHGRMGTYSLDIVKSVVMMSDGAWEMQGTFHGFDSTEKFVKAILTSESLSEIIDDLRNRQDSDPNLNEFPRMKLKDDATLVFLEVEEKDRV